MSEIVFDRISLLKSIGSKINGLFELPVYIYPNPQGVSTPCFFVQYMNSSDSVEDEVGKGVYKYNLNIDVIYLEDAQNIQANKNILNVLTILEANMQSVEYTDENNNTASLKVFRPKSNWNMNDLHYQFTLIFRAFKQPEKEYSKLQNVVIETKIKEKGVKNG